MNNKMQGLTLEDVIDNEESRQIFRNYLVVSHNEDPLSFIDAVEQYERMKSHANRFESAQEMIKTYIEPCARHELNISQVTRSSTINQFTEQCSRSHCPKKFVWFVQCWCLVRAQGRCVAKVYQLCLRISNDVSLCSCLTNVSHGRATQSQHQQHQQQQQEQ